ncbi:MAG TPA: L-seryl-tRNA(Sec) selenium transferase [Lentisphaeria bacterium]|nr:MAG: L-seryl-tRNA(Sec) selenium transferase [Lentisphaerae bacterium GWF2_50_93]HCE45877.1 L-seryl-tRNA(Sec) selenium transferase [Lentisphaeria bacterium]
MKNEKEVLLKSLPQLGVLLEKPEIATVKSKFGAGMTKLFLREAISEARDKILKGKLDTPPSDRQLIGEAVKKLTRTSSPEGRRAINATGILLHTGLGRAPFCDEAIAQMKVFSGYSILQTDLGSGKRSLREEKIEKMLVELTGCEAATVVNNNAAATMLILNTLSEYKETIVSRGQLIEIGGEFRMPDVMQKSRAILREVGTTNRTHLKDYEAAINQNTGAVIHVHTSNYRVRGFTGTPKISELRKLLNRHPGVPLIDDLGSGALVSLSQFGLPDEPLVTDSLAAGADVVCFSGDKLICGPQSGIICGKKEIVDRIRKNPYARMFRICKMTVAAIESTLIHFVNGTYKEKLPLYRMLSEDMKSLDKRAGKLVAQLSRNKKIKASAEDDSAYIGSGAIPDEGIPSRVVKVGGNFSPDEISEKLRGNMPSIFCRINDDSLVFDMRSLMPDDFEALMKELPDIFSLGK